MMPPATPADEEARIAALHDLCILDTPPEERFDRITRLAQVLLDVPICLISLVDRDRQWFKSRQGIDVSETPRALSFCAHAILDPGPLVIEDARADPRFQDNPLVCGAPYVRFYAGQPLHGPDGSRLGTLCVIDRVPRHPGREQLRWLRDLADIVEGELRLVRIAELQREVNAAQEELRRFFSLSLDLLCIAGADGYFKKLNPAWTQVLGHSIEELCARPFIEFVHPDDRDATRAEARKLGAGGATIEFENRYRCRDGSYRILNWSAVADPATGSLLAVARDITRLRSAEEELRVARRVAESASQAKSRFLANMSHEFRTPLNSVIGFTAVLLEDPAGLDERQKSYLERIRTNGRNLLGLVNEILDLSKIEAGKVTLVPETIAPAELVREAVSQFEVQAREKGLRIETDIPAVLAPLETDPQRLRQVLINLLGNAVKFTPQGFVATRVVADDAGVVRRIEIADSGVGIPADQQERIFEAFDQGAPDPAGASPGTGTGLGLAIARSLCGLLGCRLELESTPGEGSKFTIHLPAGRPRG
jgi:PAS domain S-box-containing protein